MAFRPAHPLGGAVGFRKRPFLVHRHAGKAVVRRIAEDDENRRILLHPSGAVALFLEFGKRQLLLRFRRPAGERVGEEDAGAFVAIVREGRVQLTQRQPDLQVRHHERRRHDLEAEDAARRRLLHPRADEGAHAPPGQVGGDAAQHFRQIGAGAAARVQHIDVLGREAIGDAKIVLQRPIHPRHHVAHHLRWRVPHAQLLAQRRVERLQEWLVEVRHRLALVEAGEEGRLIHALKGRGGPVQHFHEAQGVQPAGGRNLLKQRPQHRHPQMPRRFPPAEGGGRGALRFTLPVPQHPRREDAVEQCLHQCGMEESGAGAAIEAHAEGVLQRRAERRQRVGVRGGFQPRQAIAGVGGEQVRQVLRFRDGGAVRQGAAQVFAEGGAVAFGEGAWLLQPLLELRRARRQPEGLQLARAALGVFAKQHEVAEVRHQHQAVAMPVLAHLVAFRGEPRIIRQRLRFHHAVLRRLAFADAAGLELPCREEAEVWVAGAEVGQFADAEHLGLQRGADGVQEVAQRRVARAFAGGGAGRGDALQGREIGFNRRRQLHQGTWPFKAAGRAGWRKSPGASRAFRRRPSPPASGGI